MKLFASPWSPPTWMKDPPVYNFGRLVRSPANLRAYALYFLKFVRAYAAEGIAIHQVHVQNEPMSSQKFPSCVWTGEELREFIADYLGPLFEREKCPAEIWLGTLNGPETDNRFLRTGFNDYANLVLSDPRARRHVRGVAYQWAGKYAMQRTRLAWPEVPLIQSENECGDGNNTWAYAGYVFDLLHHYLVNDAEAYVYWNMALAPGGESSWGWRQNSLLTADPQAGRVSTNPEYHVMRHFAQFVRPGWRRLHLEGHWAGNAVAFRGDGRTVAVVRNPFARSASLTLALGGRTWKLVLDPGSINTLSLSRHL
jgi:glucosylceramidase